MPLLWLLPRSRDGRYLGVIGLLLVLLILSLRRITQLDSALAMKPKIEVHTVTETKIVEKKIAGPVVIREKIVTRPGGEKIVERLIERAEVRVDRVSGQTLAQMARPICPAFEGVKTWAVGGALNLRHRDRGSVGLSKSFGNLSLGASHAVGAGAHVGDISAGLSLKVF